MCADLSGSRSWVISTETAAIGQASPGLAGSPKKESDPSRFLSPPVTPRCPGHSSQHPTPAVQKASGRPAAPSLAFASEASRSLCLQEPLPPRRHFRLQHQQPVARVWRMDRGCVTAPAPPSRNLLNTPHTGGRTQWWQQQHQRRVWKTSGGGRG